jgi:transposase
MGCVPRHEGSCLEAPAPGSVLAEGDASGMARPRTYPDELREHAIRFYFESDRPIAHVAHDLGIHKEGLRQWVRQAEADQGRRLELLKTNRREELKRLREASAVASWFDVQPLGVVLSDTSSLLVGCRGSGRDPSGPMVMSLGRHRVHAMIAAAWSYGRRTGGAGARVTGDAVAVTSNQSSHSKAFRCAPSPARDRTCGLPRRR